MLYNKRISNQFFIYSLRFPTMFRFASRTVACSRSRLAPSVSFQSCRYMHSPIKDEEQMHDKSDWKRAKRQGDTATRFPDWIEKCDRKMFYRIATGMTAVAGGVTIAFGPSLLSFCAIAPTALYWYLGLRDIKQTRHTIRRNFPVLGNVRYLLESIRPEIRQYFIESDEVAIPFNRYDRNTSYQRAKAMSDTLPFGTRKDVYKTGYEWVNHSIWPSVVPKENERITIGGPHCKKPYSASILNISGMSYGALSDNAILALNEGASLGNFYHNTGEGGISKFHLKNGGDLVWNVGTGYFGCRDSNGNFNPEMFKKNASQEQVKMIELKLSQGAKPGHGGILPAAKITQNIADARGLSPEEMDKDCVSPPYHTAFYGAKGLVQFIDELRTLSGGKPVGWKMCVGRPEEFAAICHAMIELDITPDFITIDGGEGGTGAAPPEFSNRVGSPLTEALFLVDTMLVGAGLRERIKIISAGKIITGFHLVRQLALGADICNSARGMMFALGCIQALKCNTNKCPSGVATQDPELMKGLYVPNKSQRVYQFHQKTVEAALELIGAAGLDHPDKLSPDHIVKRIGQMKVQPYSKLYPRTPKNSLIVGTGPALQQLWWDQGKELLDQQEQNKHKKEHTEV